MPVKGRAPPRSPNAQTSRPDVGGAATRADGHQPSTRTSTDAATSSNAASSGSSNGAVAPPDATNSPATTKQPSPRQHPPLDQQITHRTGPSDNVLHDEHATAHDISPSPRRQVPPAVSVQQIEREGGEADSRCCEERLSRKTPTVTQSRAEPSRPPCGLGRWVSGAAGTVARRSRCWRRCWRPGRAGRTWGRRRTAGCPRPQRRGTRTAGARRSGRAA
jgi:hypothetical protein